jgi:hypothetical protein
VEPVGARRLQELAGFGGGERFEASVAYLADLDVAGDVAFDAFVLDGLLECGVEDGVDVLEGAWGEAFPAAASPSCTTSHSPAPGIEVRTHATTLYNSLYCADDQQLVNAHVWGVNAYAAPVWHLRRHETGGMFDTYTDSFDAVWTTATPVHQEG